MSYDSQADYLRALAEDHRAGLARNVRILELARMNGEHCELRPYLAGEVAFVVPPQWHDLAGAMVLILPEGTR